MARGIRAPWRGGALLAALAGLLLACGTPAAPSAAQSSGPPPTAPAPAVPAAPSPPASLVSVTYATQRPVSPAFHAAAITRENQACCLRIRL